MRLCSSFLLSVPIIFTPFTFHFSNNVFQHSFSQCWALWVFIWRIFNIGLSLSFSRARFSPLIFPQHSLSLALSLFSVLLLSHIIKMRSEKATETTPTSPITHFLSLGQVLICGNSSIFFSVWVQVFYSPRTHSFTYKREKDFKFFFFGVCACEREGRWGWMVGVVSEGGGAECE